MGLYWIELMNRYAGYIVWTKTKKSDISSGMDPSYRAISAMALQSGDVRHGKFNIWHVTEDQCSGLREISNWKEKCHVLLLPNDYQGPSMVGSVALTNIRYPVIFKRRPCPIPSAFYIPFIISHAASQYWHAPKCRSLDCVTWSDIHVHHSIWNW